MSSSPQVLVGFSVDGQQSTLDVGMVAGVPRCVEISPLPSAQRGECASALFITTGLDVGANAYRVISSYDQSNLPDIIARLP